jgi:hypothetical protein
VAARGIGGSGRITLPVRVFLYTLDQVGTILGIDEDTLITKYLYFRGISTGVQGRRMMAHNVEIDENARPRWRVAEAEVLRYLRDAGFRVDRAEVR